jgi:hypothetical protein
MRRIAATRSSTNAWAGLSPMVAIEGSVDAKGCNRLAWLEIGCGSKRIHILYMPYDFIDSTGLNYGAICA